MTDETGDPLEDAWVLERLGRWPMRKVLKEGDNLIGRAVSADIHTVSLFASRRHCIITKERDSLMLEDLDSFNGTFVNGQKVKGTTCELKLGDVVAIGGDMDDTDANYRANCFVFRVRNTKMEADVKEDTIDHNEPLEHLLAENLPQVKLEIEVDDDQQYSLHILSQIAEDIEESPLNAPEDEEPMDFPAEPPQAFSPEIIDLISSDEEDDLDRNVDQWMSRLSQSQHKEVLVKTNRSPDAAGPIVMKEVKVLISPLVMPQRREEEEAVPSDDDDEVIPPKRRRPPCLIISSEESVGEDQVTLIKPPELVEIREADQSHSVTKEEKKSSPPKSEQQSSRKRKHRRSKRKKSTEVSKPVAEVKAATVSVEELERKRTSITRKLPKIIEAPVKPKRRAHLRGFCASEMGITTKKVSLETVKTSTRTSTVTEVVRSKEIKEIRKEKLKEVSLAKTASSSKSTTAKAPCKIKVTAENRGNFLTEVLPKRPIPSRRKSFDASMEALDKKAERLPLKITMRRKSVDCRMDDSQMMTDVGSSIDNLNVWECLPSVSAAIGEKKRVAHNSKSKELMPVVAVSPMRPALQSIIIEEPQKTTTITFGEPLVEVHRYSPALPVDDEEDEEMNLSLDGVIRAVTQWNPEWLKDSEVNVPEVINQSKPIVAVKDTFDSYSSYVNTMIPLMLMDLWAILVNENFMETKEKFLVRIESMEDEEKRTVVRAFVTLPTKCNWRVGDLVMITRPTSQGLVKTFLYLRQLEVKATRLIMTFETSASDFVKNHEWRETYEVQKIATISSQMRVIDSVFNLYKSPLANIILDPTKIEDDVDAFRMWERFNYLGQDELNGNQLKTVEEVYRQCMNPRGTISLIQGPPGTGKTRVITNLVLQLLSDGPKRLYPDIKILLCAQSNAVVDFMTWRLSCMRSSMKTPNDRRRLKIVRFGVEERMNAYGKTFSLEELANRQKRDMIEKRNEPLCKQYYETKLKSFMKELEDLSKMQETLSTQAKMSHTRTKISELRRYLDGEDFGKNFIYDKVLENANVICTTLSSCSNMFKYGMESFDVCIVDEAAQSNEPMTLAPLQFGVSSLVLVGDPLQMPATVLSMEAKQHGLGQSLFKRLSSTDSISVQFLNEQYRMHPEICRFPNEYFYNNRLSTNQSVMMQQQVFPWKTYGVFSLVYSLQNPSDESNAADLDFVSALLRVMMTRAPANRYTYGIITPYSEQRSAISKKIRDISEDVFVSTIDGYQGQERDVIIICLPRTAGVGFLANSQRLNVALTRAKKCLYVCGNFVTLKRNEIWNKFLDDAKRRNLFQVINSLNQNVIQSFLMK